MQEDKMLSDPILPRGRDMDSESTGILLDPPIPQRKDKKPWHFETRCPAMQYHQPFIVADQEDRPPSRGMQERMYIPPRTWEKIPTEALGGEEKSSTREQQQTSLC